MSLLFRHLRIHQIFGANTDVGKTVLTTALVRASAKANRDVFYLKPVSTGPSQDADYSHVPKYVPHAKAACLFQLDDPVSPHLAAKRSGRDIPSDEDMNKSIRGHVQQCATKTKNGHMYIETAGGVHSPSLNGTSQLDTYRPLLLPTVLIGDSNLGGISSTVSAYESLLLRGYTVDLVLLFREEYYRNWEYLTSYFAERDVRVSAVPSPPPLLSDAQEEFRSTDAYYRSLSEDPSAEIPSSITHLDALHASRLENLDSMAHRARESIWWPFVQHAHVKTDTDVTVIDSAHSDFFSVLSPSSPSKSPTAVLEPQYDASASWWTQTFGHAHPRLTLAAARAAGRYGHVIFPQAIHQPVLELAEHLLHRGPGKGWASKVFVSDNGSTGMEVALKMALRAYTKRYGVSSNEGKKFGVLGLKGSYHGDTIGNMNACEEGVYTCEWHEAKGYWLDTPSVGIRDGRVTVKLPPCLNSGEELVEFGSVSEVYNVHSRLDTPLAETYRKYLEETLEKLKGHPNPIAALVIEPLVLGAGGMIFVDPLFQRVLVDSARAFSPSAPSSPSSSSSPTGLPVIFDEVFTGLFRLSLLSSSPLLGTHPDVLVNAKILTGGLVPLATTLATQEMFDAFVGESKSEALLHGHSYSAHPVGCEVAVETMRMLGEVMGGSGEWREARSDWGVGAGGAGESESGGEAISESGKEGGEGVCSLWSKEFVQSISKLPLVEETMTLGTVLSIKVKDSSSQDYTSHAAAQLFSSLRSLKDGEGDFSVNYRTLGNVAYFMTSLNTKSEVVRAVERKILGVLSASA